MENTCLGCKNEKSENFLQCTKCLRWAHQSCAKYYFADENSCQLCIKIILPSNENVIIRRKVDETEIFKIGFKNPQGSNTCWLNSFLHVILSLPIFDTLTQANTSHSILVKYIIKIKECMKKIQWACDTLLYCTMLTHGLPRKKERKLL